MSRRSTVSRKQPRTRPIVIELYSRSVMGLSSIDTTSTIMRLFITGKQSFNVMRLPLPHLGGNQAFEYEYEFISVTQDSKISSRCLFRSMIKLKRNREFERSKNRIPKLLSFYVFLKTDGEFLLKKTLQSKSSEICTDEGEAQQTDQTPREMVNDRRSRLPRNHVQVI